MSDCPNKLETPCKVCKANADWDNETKGTGWNWQGGFIGAHWHCANCDAPLCQSLDTWGGLHE